MEVHAADQYLVAPGEADLLEVHARLAGTGLFPLSPVELPGGVGGLVARGGFAQTFFFPAEVLGLTFRTPKGRRVRAGGVVVKNVQGYDLVRLFVGSFGLLGRAEEVVLRLRPGRAQAFLRRPFSGSFPRLVPTPRFLFALGGRGRPVALRLPLRPPQGGGAVPGGLRGEEARPLDLRPRFPRGLGLGEGPLWDLRFRYQDGGASPPPPPAFLRLARVL